MYLCFMYGAPLVVMLGMSMSSLPLGSFVVCYLSFKSVCAAQPRVGFIELVI